MLTQSIASFPWPCVKTSHPRAICRNTDLGIAGIAVRILGEVTPEKVEIARQADHVRLVISPWLCEIIC